MKRLEIDVLPAAGAANGHPVIHSESDAFRRIFLTAAGYLRDGTCWTTRAFARDVHGNEVDENDDEAVAWCCSGAVRRAVWEEGFRSGGYVKAVALCNRVLAHVLRSFGLHASSDDDGYASAVVWFNDANRHRTVDEVRDVLTKASAVDERSFRILREGGRPDA